MIDGKPRYGWEPIKYEFRSNLKIQYAVRNWPNALVNTVDAGLEVV